MTGKMWKAGIALALVGAIGGMAAWAADSPQTVEKMIHKRRVLQNQSVVQAYQDNFRRGEWRVDGSGTNPNAIGTTSIVDGHGNAVNPMFSVAGAPPPDPAGALFFGNTSYDYQHNSAAGYQVASMPGADIVHFIWMFWDKIPLSVDDADRFVNYTSYTISTATFNQPYNGTTVSLGVTARGGYPDGDVDRDNAFHGAFHQRAEAGVDYTSWHLYFPTPGSALHLDDELSTAAPFGVVLWPRVCVQQNPTPQDEIYHMVSHGDNPDVQDRIVYWRFNGTIWAGPVCIDSFAPQLAYTLAADPNSQKCAIVFMSYHTGNSGSTDVRYYESNTEGAGWISGSELGPANRHNVTNYTDANGPGGRAHTSCAYDHDGYLHIMYDEYRDANSASFITLRHWDNQFSTLRPIAIGYWPSDASPGGWNGKLTKMTMGIGDGGTLCKGGAESNLNYVYVVYTQMGGNDDASQNDYSKAGYWNGELYLSVSNTKGRTWSPPLNLTNTKTPQCDPGATPVGGTVPPRPDQVCRSEHWATINTRVHSVDIFFVEDNDAGGIPQGEGTWQLSRVGYLRYPGGTTDAPKVCPVIAANYAAFITAKTECEYHAPVGGSDVETFTLMNLGNADMSGAISVTQTNGPAGWLTTNKTGGYTIVAGDPDIIATVTMNAGSITNEGLYQGNIAVTHNAPNVPTPQNYPIDFFVVNSFFCPQYEVIKTGVASPGSLALDVRSNARFAAENSYGGMWRYVDSSNYIFDGTLLVAHGAQSSDTVVYHRFFDREDPGQYGFRAQGNLILDTSKYGIKKGIAKATAYMTTKDSTVGVKMEWAFPQHPDSDEFVLVRWSLFNWPQVSPISDVVVGVLEDQDVTPATRYGTVQSGVKNQNGGDATRNLVWQRGTDTVGNPASPPSWTATRYYGGIELIDDPPNFLGAKVGNNVSDIQPGGGPPSGWLYQTLVGLSGIVTPALPDTDMYTIMAIAKGASLDVLGHGPKFVCALISDTLSETSFKATADKAKVYANTYLKWKTERCTCGPTFGDPQVDGVTNSQDVVKTINVAFRGATPVTLTCSAYSGGNRDQTDVSCDGVTSVTDVVKVVNVAFRGGKPVDEWCCP